MKGRYLDVTCAYCDHDLEQVAADAGRSRFESRAVARCPDHGDFVIYVQLIPCREKREGATGKVTMSVRERRGALAR